MSEAESEPERPIDIFRRSVEIIEENLPATWSLSTKRSPDLSEAPLRLDLRSPDGSVAQFGVYAAHGVLSSDVPGIADRFPAGQSGFVCAKYLSEPVRRQLDAHALSYADATGNVSLTADRPAVWVRGRGADADPWRGPGRPSGQLSGDPSARVVRALADFAPPLAITALVRLAGASTGATYRVAQTLADRELVTRLPRGGIADVNWPKMLRAWAQESVAKAPTPHGFHAPDGLEALFGQLRQLSGHIYAGTASVAAAPFARYAPTQRAHFHADNVDQFADALGLRRVESGADVWVTAPLSPSVFDRILTRDGIRIVAPSQAYADLLAGPDANEEAAEYLLSWMIANESQWRRAASPATDRP
ncbi:hypothetical protein B2J88_33325 [Rhodococcus sp. SRB_17]|uniref:hypothetical protein n=1 Tax=Rhodococcus sp. OK302 TaxID=1882769 RepID=UPI000B93C757|nr:hypothetical protein [Rhodococcus sp. OK302]NMM89171.1 hypothetical protein [Rhodococcus sp. SRB_17]OYD70467.1 hypothetical protein BDB13_4086 [Rhodococcus sp. OK302]